MRFVKQSRRGTQYLFARRKHSVSLRLRRQAPDWEGRVQSPSEEVFLGSESGLVKYSAKLLRHTLRWNISGGRSKPGETFS